MYADRDDRRDEAAPSTRPTAAARSRPRTTSSTASRRRPSSARSWTSTPPAGPTDYYAVPKVSREDEPARPRHEDRIEALQAGDVRRRREPRVREGGAHPRRAEDARTHDRNRRSRSARPQRGRRGAGQSCRKLARRSVARPRPVQAQVIDCPPASSFGNNSPMKHLHGEGDLNLGLAKEVAVRAFESYQKRFANYNPKMTW